MNPIRVVNSKVVLSARHHRSKKGQEGRERKVIPKGLAGTRELAQAEHGSARPLVNRVNRMKAEGRGAQLWHQHHGTAAARSASNREGNGAAKRYPKQKERSEGGQH